MSEEVLHTGRKSFVAYISVIVGNAIFLSVINGVFYGVRWLMVDNEVSGDAVRYLNWAWIAVNVYLILQTIYILFFIRTIRWDVSEEGVRIRGGILPWAKMDMMHPFETIFEAYYRFGFFAKLFGYGECHIRRTEGVTTEISEPMMHRPGKLTGLINEKLRELRKSGPNQGAPSAGSATEELARLGQLRKDGTITEEEFQQMKRKIIES